MEPVFVTPDGDDGERLGERTVLLTFDVRQAQAARTAGITVVGA